MRLFAILEDGQRDFLDATRGILAEKAGAKPTTNSWSVLECIEHVVTVEERYQSWISSGIAIAPRRDPEKELRLFNTIRSRLTKIATSDLLRPRGRFRTLADALAAFTTVRERSILLVGERGDALYSVGVKHPYFVEINGVELIQLVDGHARRHADQIREIGEACPTPRKERNKPVREKRKLPSSATYLILPANSSA